MYKKTTHIETRIYQGFYWLKIPPITPKNQNFVLLSYFKYNIGTTKETTASKRKTQSNVTCKHSCSKDKRIWQIRLSYQGLCKNRLCVFLDNWIIQFRYYTCRNWACSQISPECLKTDKTFDILKYPWHGHKRGHFVS